MHKNTSYKPYKYNGNNIQGHQYDKSIDLSTNDAMKRSIQMDNALEQYYLKMGRNDYRDYNDHRSKGKFSKFFQENEFESDDMEDELGEDTEPQDCSYTDFDDNFPVHSSITNVEEKQKEIFRILQNVYKYGKTATAKTKFQLTDNFMKSYRIGGNTYDLKLNLVQNDVSFGLHKYKQQCKYSFANKALTDNGMAYSFAVGVRNNNFPFLQTILDIYMRDSLQCALYYNKHMSNDPIYDIHTLNDYNIKDWAAKVHLKERIKNSNGDGIFNYKNYLKGNIYDGMLSGMDKYLRICPRIHINPLMLVKDDVYQVAKYFLHAYEVVKHVINNEPKYINFQFDFAIICNKSVQKKGSCFPALWNDLSEDELLYSTDNEELDDIDAGIKWTTDELQDCIGDVDNRLSSNDCIYVKNRLSADRLLESVELLQKIDNNTDLNVLVNVCQKYLTYDFNKHRNYIMNLSSFEYRKYSNIFATEYYNRLCDEIEKLKVLSLQHVMDKVYPDMNVNRIIFEILDYEMSHESVYLLLNNLITKNMKSNSSFVENNQKILHLFEEFKSKLNIDSEFGYPNASRFCAVVDRRNEKDYKYRDTSNMNIGEAYSDTMYFFQPKQHSLIPLYTDAHILPEWHFNAIQTSFLPAFNANNYIDTNEKEYCSRYKENQQKPITSHSLCNGSLLMLSFVVESKDVIKCYLFRDSTFIRFFAQDIMDVLPKLFLSNHSNNAIFVQDNIAEVIANKMKYNDLNFQYWYNNNSI